MSEVDPVAKDVPPLTSPRQWGGANDAPAPVRELQESLKRLDRRDWWLWATAITILLLLCVAVFALSFPNFWQKEELFFQTRIELGVRGLLGMVLLFSTFALYQQFLIKHLRNNLASQIGVVSDLHGRAEVFERLAILDPLTGLFNRRFATQHLPGEVARSERHGYPFTVMMLDLDGFKRINDTYGHPAGDAALEAFARHLKRCIRSSDLPVRMGGDEFMVLLPECDTAQIQNPITRMKTCRFEFAGNSIPIEFSAGWAQHKPGEMVAELLQRADNELYKDKRRSQDTATAVSV